MRSCRYGARYGDKGGGEEKSIGKSIKFDRFAFNVNTRAINYLCLLKINLSPIYCVPMSFVGVLDHSKTDFCRINEGPINLSISMNTFLHGQTNIYQTDAVLFMAARDAMKIGSARSFFGSTGIRASRASFATHANVDVASKSFPRPVTFDDFPK